MRQSGKPGHTDRILNQEVAISGIQRTDWSTDGIREATLKRDKTRLLKSMLTASFWESLGSYLKDAAAATHREVRVHRYQ